MFSARQVLGLGLFEQAILSGSAFLMTAFVARSLPIAAFGAFGVASTIAIYLEASMFSVLGDGVPAMAARLPDRRLPELYGALFGYSTLISLGFAALTLIAGGLLAAHGSPVGAALVGVALSCPVVRINGFLRRQCYFFGLRRHTALAAATFAVTLGAALWSIHHAGLLSPASAFAAQAVASVAASLVIVMQGVAIRRPHRRMLRWSGHRLGREGRWIFGQSLLSWAGNAGLVPVVSLAGGLPAAAGLRVVQTLVSPISQLGTVMMSHLLPTTTRRLSTEPPTRYTRILNEVAAMLFFTSLGAAAFVIVFATPFLSVFGKKYVAVGETTIAVGCIGYALESFRFSYNILILYKRRARLILVGQAVACIVSYVLVVLLYPLAGIGGVVAASAIGNGANTCFVLMRTVAMVRRAASPAPRSEPAPPA